ncbi:hypothetical protein E4U55_003614 [Claviceps digitariae]|nr:hypothetical protein E4U55_003614 [Claviceps digitariae]
MPQQIRRVALRPRARARPSLMKNVCQASPRIAPRVGKHRQGSASVAKGRMRKAQAARVPEA